MKRPAARRRPREKLDPNEVRAGCRFGKELSSVKENPENLDNGLLSDRLVKPRPLSLVPEEGHETVSRGTSPIPSPLLRGRDSNSSSSAHFSYDEPASVHPSEFPDEEANLNVELPIQDIETANAPEFENAVTDSHNDKKEEPGKEREEEGEGEEEDEGEEYTENMPELVNNNRFYVMGSYKKEEEQEVNLRENAEVEVLEESEGGWWLVRTSSHSVGWAPSNFLEKVQSLKGRVEDGSGKDLLDENYIEVIPIRPPKSPRVLKMAQDMCLEKKFWHYIQKGKDMDTCPLDEKVMKPENTSSLNTSNNQPTSDAKGTNKDIMNFAFDDYECDPESGVCMRKSHKSAGVKFIPRNKVPDNGHLQAPFDVPGVIERSESVPSLAESEDFDDLPSD